jgi:hypothetical protein
MGAAAVPRYNALVHGGGGGMVRFIGIKLIDLNLVWLGMARAALYAIFAEAQQILIPVLCRQSYSADMNVMDLVGPAGRGIDEPADKE